jgi:tetratricopeptide (TPR) repeat protein
MIYITPHHSGYGSALSRLILKKFRQILFYQILSIIILNAGAIYSQQNEPHPESVILLEKGISYLDKGDNMTALEYFTKAEVLAEKEVSKKNLLTVRNRIGNTYAQMSNYGEALNYFLLALELTEKYPELNKHKGGFLNNIGYLYRMEGDDENALAYYKIAYSLVDRNSESNIKKNLGINIAIIYNEKDDVANSRKYLKEVSYKSDDGSVNTLWNIVHAENIFLSGNEKEALQIIDKLLNTADSDGACEVCMAELLSKIYEKQGDIDKAILQIKIGLASTTQLKDKENFYTRLADLYQKKNEYRIALKYKDSILINKDSLSKVINRGLYETNKVKLKVQEYQKDNERYETERVLYITALLLVLLLFFFIYRLQKNKIVKQRQEKIITDNKEVIYNLELENLKNNIAEKNRNLSAKALYLSGRNGLIQEVITSISEMPEIANKQELANRIRILKDYLRTDEEWDDFITYFEQVNPEFLKLLKEKHPDISAQDIRFLCYIYMNMEIREISNIFSITYNAGLKRSHRIKDKMHISKDISLYEYLLTLA